jgi:hypothetical protein
MAGGKLNRGVDKRRFPSLRRGQVLEKVRSHWQAKPIAVKKAR